MMGMVLAGLLGILGMTPSYGEYQVGDSVNNFTLLNWDGQPVSLYEQDERIVLLAFWSYY